MAAASAEALPEVDTLCVLGRRRPSGPLSEETLLSQDRDEASEESSVLQDTASHHSEPAV